MKNESDTLKIPTRAEFHRQQPPALCESDFCTSSPSGSIVERIERANRQYRKLCHTVSSGHFIKFDWKRRRNESE